MKILHIMLGNFYIDNYSYQENMLPKFHKQMGHDVEIVASLVSFDENGKPCRLPKPTSYINEHGIPVTRLADKKKTQTCRRLRMYTGLKEALEKAAPELIFIHNCQFADIGIVTAYLDKHPGVRVYVDNHADFSNSATNWFSRNILHKIIWRHCAHKIEPYAKKFYGVLPVRVDFLRNVYKLPHDKCELLVMGADDSEVEAADKPEIRKEIRAQYGLKDDDFVIMTGGKIDAFKTQTLLLMEAVQKIDREDVKLIVFGSVTQELKEKVNALADGKKVQYIGWVQAKDSYKYFAAADLMVFPGRHSVFWEQVVAQGRPMLCKEWPGTTHVNVNGNVRFLTQDSTEEIRTEIEKLLDPQEYQKMHDLAQKARPEFLYSDIARRSIEE